MTLLSPNSHIPPEFLFFSSFAHRQGKKQQKPTLQRIHRTPQHAPIPPPHLDAAHPHLLRPRPVPTQRQRDTIIPRPHRQQSKRNLGLVGELAQ